MLERYYLFFFLNAIRFVFLLFFAFFFLEQQLIFQKCPHLLGVRHYALRVTHVFSLFVVFGCLPVLYQGMAQHHRSIIALVAFHGTSLVEDLQLPVMREFFVIFEYSNVKIKFVSAHPIMRILFEDRFHQDLPLASHLLLGNIADHFWMRMFLSR